jgi:hypothetical protein
MRRRFAKAGRPGAVDESREKSEVDTVPSGEARR